MSTNDSQYSERKDAISFFALCAANMAEVFRHSACVVVQENKCVRLDAHG